MPELNLQIIPINLLEPYKMTVSENVLFTTFNNLEDAELSTNEFSFYIAVAAVYSSKIEGEAIELDSYIKLKRFNIEFQPDHTRKIDDLYLACQFASENKPDKDTFALMHMLLAKHIVSTNWLGAYIGA
jgi:hypothetical protein